MHARRYDPSSNTTASSSQVSQSMTSKTSSTKRKSPGGKKAQNKPMGKKGKTASSVFSNSGTPELDITEENMAIYRTIQAKLKGQKRSAAASHDEGKSF